MTCIMRLTSSMAWVTLLCLSVPRVTQGWKREDVRSGDTPSSTPSDKEVFAMVQNLVKQVAEMNNKQSRDWTRLRRAERQVKSARHDIDVMHADIIQLRQHVIEINSRLDRLDDFTSDLQLEVTKVTHDQQRRREQMGKVRHSQHVVDDTLVGLKRNFTLVDSWRTSAQNHLNRLQGWSQSLQESHRNLLATLNDLQVRTQTTPARTEVPAFRSSDDRQVSKKDLKVQQRLSAGAKYLPVLEQRFRESGSFQNRPQGDQSPDYRGGSVTVTSLNQIQNDTNFSGDGETEQDLGSGGGDEFFILEEEQYPDRKITESAEVGGGQARAVTPTPLTTSTVTTLTNPSSTLPTSPLPLCPSMADFTLLQQRVEDLSSRLKTPLLSEDVLVVLTNRTELLEAAVSRRDQQLEHMQGNVADLGVTVSRVTGQLASLRLGDFMEKLQNSLVNFTANVMTLEQWQLVSQQMLNTTDRTRRRLAELGERLTDNAQTTSDLQMTLEEQRATSKRQYRTLQTHVIRLNNSLQDLQEEMDTGLVPRKPYFERPVHGGISGPGSTNGQHGAALSSRLDDLALQLVYSGNRLSHLETQVLNSTLNSCRKSNSDLYQDASLLRVDQQLTEAQRDLVTLKDTVKRLDLGLYRLHGNSKASQEALRKVKGQMDSVTHVAEQVEALRSEVDNLLFQTPVDCEDYYQRGYRQSGEYVIYPRGAAHSLKVRCVMQLNHGDGDDDDKTEGRKKKERSGGGKGKRGKREWKEAGGWTVVHQRSSGKVNFTRSWAEYAVGFGSPHSEYWLGNEYLHLLTHHRNYTLLITLADVSGTRWRALYRPFAVGGKEDNYRLHLGRFHGNATDTLRYASGMTFSTYDKDTDVSSSPCARYNGGGWWYSHCQTSNLNGPYDVGMIWFHKEWRDWLHLRQAAMMLKPFA